jgi:hypothetical protein
MGIFDGEIVQPKFFLNLAQQLLIGFKQPHPHKSVFVFELSLMSAIATFATRTPWA